MRPSMYPFRYVSGYPYRNGSFQPFNIDSVSCIALVLSKQLSWYPFLTFLPIYSSVCFPLPATIAERNYSFSNPPFLLFSLSLSLTLSSHYYFNTYAYFMQYVNREIISLLTNIFFNKEGITGTNGEFIH